MTLPAHLQQTSRLSDCRAAANLIFDGLAALDRPATVLDSSPSRPSRLMGVGQNRRDNPCSCAEDGLMPNQDDVPTPLTPVIFHPGEVLRFEFATTTGGTAIP
jgi:hypothetical protein